VSGGVVVIGNQSEKVKKRVSEEVAVAAHNDSDSDSASE
jgi:hypothetical protein